MVGKLLTQTYAGLSDFVAQAGAPVWAIIDGVSCKDMPTIIAGNEAACLFRADRPEDAPHAPWIMRLAAQGAAIGDLGDLPVEHHWGILVASTAPLAVLKAHFRKFTMLRTPANPDAPVYFRFYDPRVMLDAMQALEPEHLAALLSPVSAVALPLSPLLGVASGLHPLADRQSYQAQVMVVTLPETAAGAANQLARAFNVDEGEYARLTALQRDRSHRKLARSLHQQFPERPHDAILTAAAYAPERGARYGLTSVQQIEAFAQCMVVIGPVFDEVEPRAKAILQNSSQAAWQKADDLLAWLSEANERAAAAMAEATE